MAGASGLEFACLVLDGVCGRLVRERRWPKMVAKWVCVKCMGLGFLTVWFVSD